MIELGHPFSKPYEELIASLEESLRYGVEQPAVDRLVFQSSLTAYELRRPVNAITRVTGLLNGTFTIFEPGVHYRLSNNRLFWLHETERPADGSRLEVEYTYREQPTSLTDFNPGSVIGTLVRTVAREMKLIYEQMDQAYRRAFIDYAEGVALDNVVALLGIERNPAVPAKGEVTFFRKQAADRRYVIPPQTRVADESGRVFLTTEAGIIAPAEQPVDELHRANGTQVTVANRIAELIGVWPTSANPATDPPLATVGTDPNFPFGEAERTITLNASTTGDLLVRYVAKSVTVPVEAAEPGPDGNVNAETIIIMPTPPPGIAGVVNEAPLTGGKVAESDEQLRERAKFYLERLGNATLNAIKFAVLELDEVEGVQVVDHSIDATIPLGEVRVFHSGGNQAEVRKVVDETRAAGILAIVGQVAEVLVAGVFYLFPAEAVPQSAAENFKAAVVEAINALEIGQPLLTRRLTALVYDIGGLADVAEAQLTDEAGSRLPDPFLVNRTQLIRPDVTRLQVVIVTTLHVAATNRVGTTNEIQLQLVSEAGLITFQNLILDLTLTVRAKLQTAPDQPAAFIGTMSGPLTKTTFTASDTATLTINDSDVPGYDAGIHASTLEITIAVTAYAGLGSADSTLDLS